MRYGTEESKFTIRSVMIAVALMAVALVAEPFFFHSVPESGEVPRPVSRRRSHSGLGLLEHRLYRASNLGDLGYDKAPRPGLARSLGPWTMQEAESAGPETKASILANSAEGRGDE